MKLFHRSTLANLVLGTSAFFVPLLTSTTSVFAQTDPPVCPPPGDQEYILLVRGQDEAERNNIASILPIESSVMICRYLDEVLVRAGGFTKLETVNAWASYMRSEEDYESFVIRPGEQLSGQTVASDNMPTETTTAPEATTAPETTTTPETTAAPEATAAPETESAAAPAVSTFEPTRLGAGYAVLVDYNSNPEVATTLGQFVSSVGLASYQQRPYLLAGYRESEESASAILQELSNAQLVTLMVDAQEVVRLSESVVLTD